MAGYLPCRGFSPTCTLSPLLCSSLAFVGSGQAPSALREEHFQLLLDDCYHSLAPQGNTAERQRRNRVLKRFPVSDLPLEGKIKKLKEIILRKHRPLTLILSFIPLLLALHQKLLFNNAEQSSLQRRLLVPFAPLLFLYFSQPADSQSEKLLHCLLHPHFPCQPNLGDRATSLSTIFPLVDMLVAIFYSETVLVLSWIRKSEISSAEAFHI